MPACFKCGKNLNANEFGRQDTCPSCNVATRVCRNCLNYDTSRYNDCAEPTADRVVDKEKSNFCDFFKLGEGGAAKVDSGLEAARKAAEALFKPRKNSE